MPYSGSITGLPSPRVIRSYHGDLRLFCEYAADPRYEWTAAHAAEYEGEPGRRALAKRELQELFDYAGERVAHARERGRKGWLTALCVRLRRRELVMLDLADFGANPHAPEFGGYGVVYVRWGKAGKGSPPKRRSVLIEITAEGRATTDQLLPGIRTVEQGILSALTHDKREYLLDLLAKILSRTAEVAAEPPEPLHGQRNRPARLTPGKTPSPVPGQPPAPLQPHPKGTAEERPEIPSHAARPRGHPRDPDARNWPLPPTASQPRTHQGDLYLTRSRRPSVETRK
jgi:hypothetical protein